jgi:hypothetical protein
VTLVIKNLSREEVEVLLQLLSEEVDLRRGSGLSWPNPDENEAVAQVVERIAHKIEEAVALTIKP